jgi:hypothetical protein
MWWKTHNIVIDSARNWFKIHTNWMKCISQVFRVSEYPPLVTNRQADRPSHQKADLDQFHSWISRDLPISQEPKYIPCIFLHKMHIIHQWQVRTSTDCDSRHQRSQASIHSFAICLSLSPSALMEFLILRSSIGVSLLAAHIFNLHCEFSQVMINFPICSERSIFHYDNSPNSPNIQNANFQICNTTLEFAAFFASRREAHHGVMHNFGASSWEMSLHKQTLQTVQSPTVTTSRCELANGSFNPLRGKKRDFNCFHAGWLFIRSDSRFAVRFDAFRIHSSLFQATALSFVVNTEVNFDRSLSVVQGGHFRDSAFVSIWLKYCRTIYRV